MESNSISSFGKSGVGASGCGACSASLAGGGAGRLTGAVVSNERTLNVFGALAEKLIRVAARKTSKPKVSKIAKPPRNRELKDR